MIIILGRKWKCGKPLELDNHQNRYIIFNIISIYFSVVYIALAVYVRSPAAYEALKSFNIMQLPSKSTFQSYTGAFLHKAGACRESIIKQVTQYKSFCQLQQDKGGAQPMSDGILIFDEVKVISSMIWNSKSHHLVFTSEGPMSAKFIMACILETIKIFQVY